MRNVVTFLWRTIYIQGVRRNYMHTLLELVALFVVFFFSTRSYDTPPLLSEGDQYDILESSEMRPYRPDILIYGPSNAYHEALMEEVAVYLSLMRRYEPKNIWEVFEDVAMRINATDEEEHPKKGKNDDRDKPLVVESVESPDMVRSTCEGVISSNASLADALCVELYSDGNEEGASNASLRFTVYMPTSVMGTETVEFPLGSFSESRKLDQAIRVQYLIEKTHVKIQRKMIEEKATFKGKEENYRIEVGELSASIFRTSKDTYGGTLSFVVHVWCFVALVRRMNAIELEFSSGLAEQQGVMGLSAANFMLGHFLTIMIYGVVESCMLLLLMYPVHSYASGIDISLMVFSFLVYSINHAIFILMLGWIFPTGWVGLIVGVVAIFFGASFVGMAEVTSLSHYILAMRESKLLCGVLPHTGFYSVLRILFVARDYGGGEAGWSLVSTKVLEKDNVTILEIWGVMLVVDVVMLFMAWYLPKVLPWASSNPQSPIFCLKPSYWISSEGAAQVTKSAPVVMDPARFEEGPPGAQPIVEVNNVTKVYNGIPALNGLSVNLYQSRVTVLLGHNGAGKTTLLNILTGVTGATSGIARVLGYDATTQRDKIRTLVSYCQQTDIFFENLTCCENLLYFGSLKGTSWAALQATIAETLKVVHLEDKAYCMPDTLSGGMKRRLSLAIAIVSKPKLVILDEPTTGLDAETRRNVWDVVQAVRKEHSVLLSSHDMEEADAIGDSIIVMARGKAVCSGSISFLKKACGVGYKITLAKVPEKFNVKNVLALIHKTVPGAEVDNDKTGEVIIALNTLNHENFPGMFKALEHDSVGLGIEAIGVTAATMKDVYLKINLDWTPGGKERETAVDERAIEELCKMVVKNPTACRRFWALFMKRLIYVTRSWSFLFVGILIPLALQLYIATSTKMPTANQWSAGDKVVINGTFPIEVRLGSHFPDSVVYLQDSTATNASQDFRLLVESEGCRVRVVKDLNKALEEIALEDFGHYMRTHPMAAAFKKNEARGLANPTSMMALPITFNMLHTALLRQLTGKPAVRITATLTYLKIENFIVQMFEYVFSFLKVMIYWSLMPALSYSLAFSAFATFPVAERLGRAREVQLMTGVSGWLFVLAHLVFDYLCYMLIMVPWCLIHYCFNKYSQTMAGAFIVTVSVFGPTVIMFCYLMAERALTPGGAMASVILWFFGGGFVLQYIVPIVPIPFSSKLFYLVPPYALLLCFVTITQWEAKTQVCSAGSGIGSLLPCDELSLYGFSSSGIGDVLLATAVGAVLLYIYMSVRLCGYFESNADQIAGSEEQQVDDDVEEETKLVNQLCSSKQFGDYALVAWKLQKRFGDLHAVRGFYLALRRSECFGLLGVNGAGKTTTFEILAGLSKATFGEAYTENATLSGRKTEWQPQISYCFQSGGLLDKLTGYEYLYLIGRLRGIPESELKGKVDSVLSIADLTPHADKQSGVYSGGNQRKLCISAALLGLPPIVFLDEPYAGVDVVSRTKIFHAVGRVKERNRTAFVLSSHNIDECEISCDRLTIMVQGQMMCLGTVQHLREKYGKGYRMHAMLKHGAASDAGAEAKRFVEAVPKQFPGIKLTDQHENMFSYHLAERIPWSELFTKVQALEKDFALEYAIAGDNTVEQIFIAFAKAGGALRQIP